MEKIKSLIYELLPNEDFDAMAIGIIDFKKNTFLTSEFLKEETSVKPSPLAYYYDLASMTKPLTNSMAYALHPGSFTPDMLLCLSHRGGLPAWGLLSADTWEEQIRSYQIKESPTLYSDFSALRVMLDFNQTGKNMKKVCSSVWDKETVYWLDLPPTGPFLQFGFKRTLPNFGEVHDPNAWVLRTFCSHAGLFSTIKGVCQTLLNYQSKTDFISKVKEDLSKHKHRFALGWDRVEYLEESLAGKGCGPSTFGHLGFTGTSIWIDPDLMRGHVILSNATKYHWYDKQGLNVMRRAIGELVWKGQW